MADRGWWRCPNDPPCPHGGVIHDIHDAEDLVPRCCAEACDCGKDRAAYLARMPTLLDGFTAGGTDG